MAEFVFRKMAAERGVSHLFSVASAATSTEEIWNGIGNPVYPPAERELKKHGIMQPKHDKYEHRRPFGRGVLPFA